MVLELVLVVATVLVGEEFRSDSVEKVYRQVERPVSVETLVGLLGARKGDPKKQHLAISRKHIQTVTILIV